MTPIGLDAGNKLNSTYTSLDREKITYWLMNFKERGVNIDPGGGRSRIVLSGVKFEGQVRDIFWGSVDPSLSQIISETFQNAAFDGKSYVDVVALKGLDEVTVELKGVVSKVFSRMAEVDRAMRGGGDPQSVKIKDVMAETTYWNGEIDRWHASLTAAFDAAKPRGIAKIGHWCEKNKLNFLPGALAGGIVAVIIKLAFG